MLHISSLLTDSHGLFVVDVYIELTDWTDFAVPFSVHLTAEGMKFGWTHLLEQYMRKDIHG